jgi:hypothetical protein
MKQDIDHLDEYEMFIIKDIHPDWLLVKRLRDNSRAWIWELKQEKHKLIERLNNQL